MSGILFGCASGTDADAQITQDWSVEKLYTEAHDELNSNNYTRAVKLYDLLQSRYPYGRFAQQALMDTAYAYYRDEEKELALATIARFQKNHPTHPDMDYMLYLKGLVLFNEDKSIMSKLSAQDWSDRDPVANKDAYFAFAQLLEQYPESKYAEDARERMEKIVNALGGHEMAVARYYMRRGAYLAAINRAQNVVAEYRNTPHVEEALAIMVSGYDKLQRPVLSADAKRVLEQNYPQSRYLAKGWFADTIPWWRYWK